MAQEESDNLNFYSKYTRSKDKHAIHSLYSLIDGAKSAERLEIHLATSRTKPLPQPKPRKTSVSPIRKLKTSGKSKLRIKEEEASSSPAPQEEDGSVASKLQELKRMEEEFHEQLDRKQRQIRRRKEWQAEQRQSKQKHPINVIDIRQTSSPAPSLPRKPASQVKLKRTESIREPQPQARQLDFEDYYREEPEVRISTAYDNSSNRNQLRNTLEMQKLREREVQSVDEDNQHPASIVIDRIDISANRGDGKQPQNNKNIYEVDLSHSRSENILDQYRSSEDSFQGQLQEQKKERQIKQNQQAKAQEELSQEKVVEKQPITDIWHLNPNGAPKQVESMENINQEEITPSDQLQQKSIELQTPEIPQEQHIPFEKQREQEKIEQVVEAPSPFLGTNKTGTEEGEELRQEIADKVGPITNRSEMVSKTSEIPVAAVYHSQASPAHRLQLSREVQSIATDSIEMSPLDNSPTDKKQKLENKKSSFKKLMAENRANLVPRMAISTILNEHINQALVDIKQASPPPAGDLQQSIVSPSESPPSGEESRQKKKVNFKKRLVEQKRDKSYSRDGKPLFERDRAKVEKNRRLLVGFFHDN